MDAFGVLLEQIKLFAIYMILGMVLVRTHVLNSITIETISKLVLRLTLPLLIFTNTVNGVTKRQIIGMFPLLLYTILVYGLLLLLSLMMSKMFRLKGNRKSIFCALGIFGNIGFMGIPIIISLFPERGMVYISVMSIIDQLLIWTLGVRLTSSKQVNQSDIALKKMVNPATISVVLALVIVFSGWTIPHVVNKALTTCGSTSTSLALVYLGGVFACINLKEYIRKIELYGIVLIKMILFPIAFFYLFSMLPIKKEVLMTISLMSAMPSMASISMMARVNGSEGDYATGAIFVTTLFSLITLPIVCWAIQ